jgi:hypothetical protein
MARLEMLEVEQASLGNPPVSSDLFYQLGMMYASGRSVPTDLIAAHKWFNLAAANGNCDAIARRRELAAEMSECDIAAAQKAAREWVTKH